MNLYKAHLCSISFTSCSVGKSVGTIITFTFGTLIYVYSVEVYFHYRDSGVPKTIVDCFYIICSVNVIIYVIIAKLTLGIRYV